MTQKIFTNSEQFFEPKTQKAKALLKKVADFNKMVDYFASEEVQKIMSQDFAIKAGEKYVECDREMPTTELDYVSAKKFSIEYEQGLWDKTETGKAYMRIETVPVIKGGKIGNKFIRAYHLKHKKSSYEDVLYFRQLEDSFIPGKRMKYMYVNETMEVVKSYKPKDKKPFLIYQKIKEAFEKNGIEMDFVFEHKYPSKEIYATRTLFLRSDFEKLFLETAELNVPCMLHNPEPDKSRVEKLLKGGYRERMIITKVKDEVNEYIKKLGFDKKFMEFVFYGNSLLTFRQADLRIANQISQGLTSASSFPVECYSVSVNKKKEQLEIA